MKKSNSGSKSQVFEKGENEGGNLYTCFAEVKVDLKKVGILYLLFKEKKTQKWTSLQFFLRFGGFYVALCQDVRDLHSGNLT